MKIEEILFNKPQIILSQLAVTVLSQQEHIRQHHPEVRITRTHHLVLILLHQVVLVEAEVAEVTVAADVHQVVVEGGNLFSNFFSFIV
jgi:response regulator RpfG family c-di-GMP phosphodiesterase